MPVLRYTFAIDPLERAEVVKWLEGLPPGVRSGQIVEVLAAHVSGPRLRDLLDELRALAQEIQALRRSGVQVQGAAGAQPGDEPDAAAAALDALVRRFES